MCIRDSPKIELLDCDLSFEIMLGDRCFTTMVSIVNTSVGSRDGYAVMLYLIDKTSEKQLLDTYNRQRIAVGEIVLDSYEEIYQTNGEIVINSIAVEPVSYTHLDVYKRQCRQYSVRLF